MRVCHWRGHGRVKDSLDRRTSSPSQGHCVTDWHCQLMPHWTRRALCNPAGRNMVRSALQDFRSELRSYHSHGEFPEAQQWNRKACHSLLFLTSTHSREQTQIRLWIHPITHKQRFMLLWDWHFYGFYWEPLFYNNAVTESQNNKYRQSETFGWSSLSGEFTENDMQLLFVSF